jgi:hypothetical protein
MRLADRVLTAEQQTQLVALLTPFRDTEVDIVIFGDTSEIKNFGMTLLNCLRDAGWNVTSGNAMRDLVVVKSILVGVRLDANIMISDAAKTFISELQSIGIVSGRHL